MKTTKTQKSGGREARLAAITERNHQAALAEFVGTIAQIREALTALQTATWDDHLGVDPDEVNYGHVGDAKRILMALRETLAIARNEQE